MDTPLCKHCIHMHIKSMRDFRADQAVCFALERYTGLPRHTKCIDERASSKAGDCGPTGLEFQKRC